MATKKELRDSRLDDLKNAIKAWAKQRKKDLNNQVTFSKRVLKGRTGSERLTSESVKSASSLTVDEIDDFLNG